MEAFAGLSKGTSPFSFIIQWGQKGRYSHAFFAFLYLGKWYVVDSTTKGIKIHLMAEFEKHNRIVKRFEIVSTEEQKKEVMRLAIARSYDKYPKLEIVGNAIQLIVKWLSFGKIKIKNPFKLGEKSPRCQEFAAIILRDIYGFDIKENLDSTDLLWFDDKLTKLLK